MTLEELIRDRAAKGELNYLSIAFTDRGFEVAYRGVQKWDGAMSAHYDPVCAILKALTGKTGPEPPRPVQLRNLRKKPKVVIAATGTSEFDDLL